LKGEAGWGWSRETADVDVSRGDSEAAAAARATSDGSRVTSKLARLLRENDGPLFFTGSGGRPLKQII